MTFTSSWRGMRSSSAHNRNSTSKGLGGMTLCLPLIPLGHAAESVTDTNEGKHNETRGKTWGAQPVSYWTHITVIVVILIIMLIIVDE
jgi:hypothetical protein